MVIEVDPPAGENGGGCGIVVCGLLSDGRGVVLADVQRRWAAARGLGAARVAAAFAAWVGGPGDRRGQ